MKDTETIKKIKNRKDLYSIEPIYLSCILMDNNEILFNGKSLGFITDEEIQKWAYVK